MEPVKAMVLENALGCPGSGCLVEVQPSLQIDCQQAIFPPAQRELHIPGCFIQGKGQRKGYDADHPAKREPDDNPEQVPYDAFPNIHADRPLPIF